MNTKKTALLALDGVIVGSTKIRVAETKAETKHKKVIYVIPTSEPNIPKDNTLLSLLRKNGVSKAFRVTKMINGVNTPITTWILTFTSTPPLNIVLGYQNFPIANCKRSFTHCTKCWEFGHAKNHCPNTVRCRIRIFNHPPENACLSGPFRPTTTVQTKSLGHGHTTQYFLSSCEVNSHSIY